MQLFYNLSDPGMEDLLYEVESVRRFVGLRLSGPLPDETTILNFRHLLETHAGGGVVRGDQRASGVAGAALEEGNDRGREHHRRAVVDEEPQGRTDPQMHQTKKGKQWYFGMKAHIGVDAESGLAHSLATTSANAADVGQASGLLRGDETEAWGDAGYQGVEKRPENEGSAVAWQVAMKPGRRRLLDKDGAEAAAEKRKAAVRAKVEHPFLYLKRHFGYGKVRYRGLAEHATPHCCSDSRICSSPAATRPDNATSPPVDRPRAGNGQIEAISWRFGPFLRCGT